MWKPLIGDIYYYRETNGDIWSCRWYGNKTDNERLTNNNVFKTLSELKGE